MKKAFILQHFGGRQVKKKQELLSDASSDETLNFPLGRHYFSNKSRKLIIESS